MANYQFGSDLFTDILWRSGEPTDGTSEYTSVAKQYLNRAYQAVWTGGAELDPGINEDWWWLRKDPPGTLTLDPSITTGTASVTHNSASVTLSSALTKDVAGWFFKADDNADIFRISTATGTAVTLDSVYTRATSTGASYKIFRLEYSLATDVLRLSGPMRDSQDNQEKIDGQSEEAMHRDFPLAKVEAGVPTKFALIGQRKIRFNKYGSSTTGNLIRVEYPYLRVPGALTTGATGEPLLPLEYRRILSDYATALLQEDKSDSKSSHSFELARRLIKAMSIENRNRMGEIDEDYGKVHSRQGDLPQYIGPLRTQTGLIVG